MTKSETKSEQCQLTKGQQLFGGAEESTKELIRSILAEERRVMYLQRRSDIYRRIVEHVKRVIK